ncbi:hypothetical protein BH09BAC6_BH09BAC6_10510 [soil metagenome]
MKSAIDKEQGNIDGRVVLGDERGNVGTSSVIFFLLFFLPMCCKSGLLMQWTWRLSFAPTVQFFPFPVFSTDLLHRWCSFCFCFFPPTYCTYGAIFFFSFISTDLLHRWCCFCFLFFFYRRFAPMVQFRFFNLLHLRRTFILFFFSTDVCTDGAISVLQD